MSRRSSHPSLDMSSTPTPSVSAFASSASTLESRQFAHDFNVGLNIGSSIALCPLQAAAGKVAVKPSPKRRKPKRPMEAHEWDDVRDPKERRKAQNRCAQRTYRAKARGKAGDGTPRISSESRLALSPPTCLCYLIVRRPLTFSDSSGIVSTPAQKIVFGVPSHQQGSGMEARTRDSR
jgi:hypothetical protein